MDGLIAVEILNEGQNIVLRGFGGKRVLDGVEAAFLRHAALGRNVDVRGRIVTDDNNGKPRLHPASRFKFGGCGSHLLDHRGRDRLAVDYVRHDDNSHV